jgi:hypothetical protein
MSGNRAAIRLTFWAFFWECKKIVGVFSAPRRGENQNAHELFTHSLNSLVEQAPCFFGKMLYHRGSAFDRRKHKETFVP